MKLTKEQLLENIRSLLTDYKNSMNKEDEDDHQMIVEIEELILTDDISSIINGLSSLSYDVQAAFNFLYKAVTGEDMKDWFNITGTWDT